MNINQWQGCYDQGWGNNLVSAAYTHPAKVSFKLAERIYKHAIKNHWIEKGGIVLDPFGGICGFGFHAMVNGLNFIGVELEEKFVKLGEQNIELWHRTLVGWPFLGTARIVQGDSRKIVAELWFEGFKDVVEDNCYLRNVVFKGDLIISSPNFPTDQPCQSQTIAKKDYHAFTRGDGTKRDHKMRSPGNLANMKEGNIDLVVSSPPYVDSVNSGPSGIDHSKSKGGRNRAEEVKRTGCVSCQAIGEQRYGQSPGQLGSMKEGSIDAVISSPPYEKSVSSDRDGIDWEKAGRPDRMIPHETAHYPQGVHGDFRYSKSQNNLGNSSGDTFWSASKEIVSQCYDLLKPNGMSIWVCKDYIKAKKRVPFSDRWLFLCESVGFKLVCRHQASLVKEHGIQTTIHGDKKITTERKSFFRRLAESKGSPRIDYEDVLCLVK